MVTHWPTMNEEIISLEREREDNTINLHYVTEFLICTGDYQNLTNHQKKVTVMVLLFSLIGINSLASQLHFSGFFHFQPWPDNLKEKFVTVRRIKL